MGVITHPLDDGVRGFYARWGFQDLPFDPRRAMVARMLDLQRVFGSEIEPRGFGRLCATLSSERPHSGARFCT
jgi:hypothetical protein